MNIFGLAALLNRRAKPEFVIPKSHQVVMWFSGLRGAIAVTLAVQVPGQFHDEIVMTTLVIVLFTTFVLGGLSEDVIRALNIETGPDAAAAMPSPPRSTDSSSQEGDLRELHRNRMVSIARLMKRGHRPRSFGELVHKLDQLVLRPLLIDETVDTLYATGEPSAPGADDDEEETHADETGSINGRSQRTSAVTSTQLHDDHALDYGRDLHEGPSGAQIKVLATLPLRAERLHAEHHVSAGGQPRPLPRAASGDYVVQPAQRTGVAANGRSGSDLGRASTFHAAQAPRGAPGEAPHEEHGV